MAHEVVRDGTVLLMSNLSKPSRLTIIGQDSTTNPPTATACTDRGCDTGTLGTGRGNGSTQPPDQTSPCTAISSQAAIDGTRVTLTNTGTTSSGASAASAAATAIVFIISDPGEWFITIEGRAGEGSNLDPWRSGNSLVQAVAAISKNIIVWIHSVGPVILGEHPDAARRRDSGLSWLAWPGGR